MTDELMALADRVEALAVLTNADWELEDAIKRAVWPLGIKPGPFLSSLDAAMTLVPDGWNWMAGERNQGRCRAYVENDKPAFEGMSNRRHPDRLWFEVVAATPALALTAAALRARAAKEPEA